MCVPHDVDLDVEGGEGGDGLVGRAPNLGTCRYAFSLDSKSPHHHSSRMAVY